MEESKDTAESRRMRKEQERERRRVRDRERRQSMSQEERERHLARRRRNYQLRRQRAESARLDSQMQLISGGELLIGSEDLLAASSPDSGMHFEGAIVALESDKGQDASGYGYNRNESLDIPLDNVAGVGGRLRLSHLKQLARTLNKCGRETLTQRIPGDMTAKSNGSTRWALSSGLRLSRFKRLARSFKSSTGESSGKELEQRKTEKVNGRKGGV